MKKLILIPLVALSFSTVASASEEALKENFLEADANGDEQLTESEFKTLIDLNAADNIGKASKVKRFKKYSTAFKKLDTDGNGLITKAEVKALAESKK